MSEFKVGDRVRVRARAGLLPSMREGRVVSAYRATKMAEVDFGGDTFATRFYFSQLEHVEPKAPEEARAECNIASHEEMVAECMRLRAENVELLRENAVMRRRNEKLEKKR